jgi:hypothetical protein
MPILRIVLSHHAIRGNKTGLTDCHAYIYVHCTCIGGHPIL